MFLSAYKKDGMDKSQKEKTSSENLTAVKSSIKQSKNIKEKEFNNTKSNDNITDSSKKKANQSNFSLDKFENKTKKGIKFGLLEYKRLYDSKNFDICNCNNKKFLNFPIKNSFGFFQLYEKM